MAAEAGSPASGPVREPARMSLARLALALCAALAATPAPAQETATVLGRPLTEEARRTHRLCALIEREAGRTDLPAAFFARLLWKESRFDIGAISPKGAQGVAQFMPATAALRGLDDPYDPEQAIRASASYLAELRERFGNLGLAAAAYNAGEARVERWIAGRSGLPYETLDYVRSITWRDADWFRRAGREVEPRPLDPGRSFAEACRDLPVMRTRAILDTGAPWRPWGVQVAAAVSPGAARAAFERVRRAHGPVIGANPPMIVRNSKAARSSAKWMVRLGADSRAEAARLCQRLKGRGGSCMVMRN